MPEASMLSRSKVRYCSVGRLIGERQVKLPKMSHIMLTERELP